MQTIIYIKHTKGSVTSYDTQPGYEIGLFYNVTEPIWGTRILCNAGCKQLTVQHNGKFIAPQQRQQYD